MQDDDIFTQAMALQRAGQFAQAEPLLRSVPASHPQYWHALSQLGVIHAARGTLEEAMALMKQALALNPRSDFTWYNLGLAQAMLARYTEALTSYDHALAIDNDYAEAHWHRSLILLTLGRYEEGWKEYEWRFKLHSRPLRYEQPLWRGDSPLAGKTILLHGEQGMGDTIQFSRYIPLVANQGARVIAQVAPPLIALLGTLNLNAPVTFVSEGQALPAFDLHCPLFSLPHAFGTTLATVPAHMPYLFADAKRAEAWKRYLGPKQLPRIGLVWSGAKGYANDHNRTIALRHFSVLFTLFAGIERRYAFHVLQKDIRLEDMQVIQQNALPVYSEALTDFAETAALVAQMDVVITVDTAVAHLAGALGKPVWILLPYAADFRWLTATRQSPWYPTARLFRQPSPDNWHSVIDEVASLLENLNL